MSETATKPEHDFSNRARYDALMEVVRNRMTVRAFLGGALFDRLDRDPEPCRLEDCAQAA